MSIQGETGWTPDPPESPLLDRIASLCLAAMAAIKQDDIESAQKLFIEALAILEDELPECECEWELDIAQTATSPDATFYECVGGCGAELKMIVYEEDPDDPDTDKPDDEEGDDEDD